MFDRVVGYMIGLVVGVMLDFARVFVLGIGLDLGVGFEMIFLGLSLLLFITLVLCLFLSLVLCPSLFVF